jgi:uncharacterized membrane protein
MSVQFVGVLLLAVWLAGCAGKPVPPPPPPPEAPMPAPFRATHTAVLDCEDLAPVGVLVNETTARIDAPRGPLDMAQVVSASGALYEGEGHRLWFKGDTATFRQPDEDVGHECRVYTASGPWESARLRGVEFRAIGQEPGWLVEVLPQKWTLVLTDYGSNRLLLPPVAAVAFGGGKRWSMRSGTHTIEMLAMPVACSDGMSDEQFDTQVTLIVDGVTLRGCGRWLAE